IGAARGDDGERASRLRREAAKELRVGLREHRLAARVALEADRASGRVDLGHWGAASAQSSHENGVHGDAFGLRARDRAVDPALEVLAVRKNDGVPATRRSGRKEVGRGRETRGERRAGPGAHAGLHRVEKESDGRRVESERHEGLGFSFAGDQRGAVASEARQERLRRLPREDEARGRNVSRTHRGGGVEDEDDVGAPPLRGLGRFPPARPRERAAEAEHDEKREHGACGGGTARGGAARPRRERGAPGGAPPDGEDERAGCHGREKESGKEHRRLGKKRRPRAHRGVTGNRKSVANPAMARHAAAGRVAIGKTSRKRVYFVVLISLFSSLSIVANVSARPFASVARKKRPPVAFAMRWSSASSTSTFARTRRWVTRPVSGSRIGMGISTGPLFVPTPTV